MFVSFAVFFRVAVGSIPEEAAGPGLPSRAGLPCGRGKRQGPARFVYSAISLSFEFNVQRFQLVSVKFQDVKVNHTIKCEGTSKTIYSDSNDRRNG